MDVIVGVRGHLASLSVLTALVPATRIYSPILQAKANYPAIQLKVISDVSGHHLRGPNDVFEDRVQVDSWAKTRDQAKIVGTLCRQRLDGFKGYWIGTGSPQPFLVVQGVFLLEARELFEDEIDGGLCRHSADYLIVYTNSEEQILINA